jgi:hypothetical protein
MLHAWYPMLQLLGEFPLARYWADECSSVDDSEGRRYCIRGDFRFSMAMTNALCLAGFEIVY